MLIIPEVWLGSKETLLQVVRAAQYAVEHPLQFEPRISCGLVENREEEEDNRTWEERFLDSASDAIIEERGRVGMVKISGPLVSDNSFWNQLFGLTSYDTVSLALQKVMMERPGIEYAVMVMDTGGGSADGVDNISNNIEALKSASDVTLLTHVQSAALSAGYWIGAHGDVIYGNRMAEAGGIGVIMTHRSISESLKQNGVKDTVIHSGKEKAYGHPSLPLSKAAEAKLQEQSDKLYSFFLDHVAEQQHLFTENATTWADGQSFFMQDAVDVGLADFVMPFNELLDELNEGFEEEKPVYSAPDPITGVEGIQRG
jgi:ClpP class serine protease